MGAIEYVKVAVEDVGELAVDLDSFSKSAVLDFIKPPIADPEDGVVERIPRWRVVSLPWVLPSRNKDNVMNDG